MPKTSTAAFNAAPRNLTRLTPPRRKYQRIDESKRRALLDEALREFGQQGFEAASLQRIATKAGIGRGLLYYYFEDRNDFIRAAIAQLQSEIAPVTPSPPASPEAAVTDFWLTIESFYRASFGLLLADPTKQAFVRRVLESARMGNAPEPVRELLAAVRAHATAMLERGRATGDVRDDVPVALLTDAALALVLATDTWVLSSVALGADVQDCMNTALRLVRSFVGPPARRSQRR